MVMLHPNHSQRNPSVAVSPLHSFVTFDAFAANPDFPRIEMRVDGDVLDEWSLDRDREFSFTDPTTGISQYRADSKRKPSPCEEGFGLI